MLEGWNWSGPGFSECLQLYVPACSAQRPRAADGGRWMVQTLMAGAGAERDVRTGPGLGARGQPQMTSRQTGSGVARSLSHGGRRRPRPGAETTRGDSRLGATRGDSGRLGARRGDVHGRGRVRKRAGGRGCPGPSQAQPKGRYCWPFLRL